MRHISFLIVLSLSLSACGGGGSDSSATLIDSVGSWSGAVSLTSNSCQRDIPLESQTINFSHQISEVAESEMLSTVTLKDQLIGCRDLRADPQANHFIAVCPRNALPGFLPNLTCTEERVWEYTIVSAEAGVADVVRTAYVQCSKNGVLQFACPVVYNGSANRE